MKAAVLTLALLAAAVASGAGAAGSAAPTCRTPQLSAALTGPDGGVGHFGSFVVLTNRSTTACTLRGYLSFRLLNAKRAPMPTYVAHGSTYLNGKDPGPRTIVLAPKGHARAFVEWSHVPTGNEPTDRACEPTSAYLRVTPPGSTRGITLKFGDVVCGHGGLLTSALTR